MKVCTVDEMREIDALASQKFHIPEIVLMENAAEACVREIECFESFTVICGKGNNGGDGLAVARKLLNRGKRVNIYLACGDGFSGSALRNYEILRAVGAEIKDCEDIAGLAADIAASDCVVDAIFGTGFCGESNFRMAEIIDAVNENASFVLSADVPSGVNAQNGEVGKTAVKAHKTVTFAAYKPGLLLYPGADFAGRVICADISIPRALTEGLKVNTIDEKYVRSIMPKRRKNSHKGDYGKVFVIGGSRGMAGAAVLACEGAFKVGAGIVTACVPDEINDIVQTACPKAMTFPVDFGREKNAALRTCLEGENCVTFSADFVSETDRIVKKMQEYDVILFGNGIGRGEHVTKLLKTVLKEARVPVVIDADGLFALAENPQMLDECIIDVILTPHSAEMARLLNVTAEDIEKNRFSASGEFASKYGLTLVLKGNHSIITAPCGNQYVNMTGNSGMATAGSGDVLAGMTAGLAAVCPPDDAAVLAVYLHGAAGDWAGNSLTEYAVTAPDILDAIPHILPVEKSIEI